MKNLGILGLTLAFLVQIMGSSLIVLNYEVNTSYIIENFCENTDKPEMHCDGKCHLTKQIQEDTEQKSEAPAAESEIMTFVLSIEETAVFEFGFLESRLAKANSLYLEGNYSNPLQSIFHPPQV